MRPNSVAQTTSVRFSSPRCFMSAIRAAVGWSIISACIACVLAMFPCDSQLVIPFPPQIGVARKFFQVLRVESLEQINGLSIGGRRQRRWSVQIVRRVFRVEIRALECGR